ncbi:MAG: DUF3450 family protein [Phycisphaeraceae bacterium]
MKRLLSIVLAGWVSIAADAAPAQPAGDAESQLAREIRQTISELHDLRRARLAEAASHRSAVDALERQIDRLETDLSRIGKDAAAQEQAVADLRTRRQELEQSADAASELVTHAAEAAAPVAAAIEQRVSEGIPFEKAPRRSRAEAIAAGLDEPGLMEQSAALTDLWSMLDAEFRLAGGRDLWNEPVRLQQGRRVHAYQVRLGLIGQWFVSEDRQTLGLAAPGRDQPWLLKLPGAWQTPLREAVGILREQRPPGLTPVPFAHPQTPSRTDSAEGGTQ